MLRRSLIISFLLIASPALADEQEQQFLSKALAALQQQRNSANDDAANARAQAAVLRDQIAPQQATIAELNAWIEAAKPKIPATGEPAK